jgi:predicted peroxiredoxin
MNKFLKTLLVLPFLLMLLAVGPLSADEKSKTIFYNITTDEAWAGGMALGQANKALENGYKVVLFLNVRGVFLASKTFHTDTLSASGMSLQDMLKAAIKKGAKAVICPMCMKKAGMTKEDIIDGVEKGGPNVTMKLMTADDTVIMSY